MTRTIPCASHEGASLTTETGHAPQNFDRASRKGRGARRAPQPAGVGELRSAPVFASVDEETVARLSADARIESLQAGDLLFRQGAAVSEVAFVLSGYVKLLRISSGRQALISICSADEMIGELPIKGGKVHTFSAEAAGATRVLKLPAAPLARLVKESPSLCAAVMEEYSKGIARLIVEIETLKSQNADQRLAHFILALCPPGEDRCRFRLPYDKRLIAARLGVKQETLSRAFAKLRAHGVRTETRNVHVESVSHLADQCDQLGRAPRLTFTRRKAANSHDAA
jgi:CRP-like cAMP-binding protein